MISYVHCHAYDIMCYISKLGYYYIILFYFAILYALYHLSFANIQTMIFHCFIISKRTIISLMTLLFFHLFHPHKLFLLLQLSHHYLHYFNIKLLLLLSFSKTVLTLFSVRIYCCYYCYSDTIICIIYIKLLLLLSFSKPNILIISFR